jgi:hypothetical protein
MRRAGRELGQSWGTGSSLILWDDIVLKRHNHHSTDAADLSGNIVIEVHCRGMLCWITSHWEVKFSRVLRTDFFIAVKQ